MGGYALLTAAKNEEKYIANALSAVIRQTVLPDIWVIVDDGSNDATPEIVSDYAKKYPFIQLISKSDGNVRSFGAQYRALNMAYDKIKNMPFKFIGVLDADVAVERDDYYEKLLLTFDDNTDVGIAGGYIFELNRGKWCARSGNSLDSVAGGIQMFRRACYEKIGGYTPRSFGGEDWLAQIDAKRHGWGIKVLPELAAHHYRPTSSADGRLRGLFRLGRMDASFGSNLWFEILKCGRRIGEKPFLLGSIVRWSGYVWESLIGKGAQLTENQLAYLRMEQRQKIHSWRRQIRGPNLDRM